MTCPQCEGPLVIDTDAETESPTLPYGRRAFSRFLEIERHVATVVFCCECEYARVVRIAGTAAPYTGGRL